MTTDWDVEEGTDGLKPDSMLAQLVETIGWPATVQLCGRFGGEEIYIPKPDSIFTAQRSAEILRDYQDGLSYPEIARKHGVTTTYARVVVSRLTRGEQQPPKQSNGAA